MSTRTQFLDFYQTDGLSDQEVDDRVNEAQSRRTLENGVGHVSLDLDLMSEDSLSEALGEVVDKWRATKHPAATIFPLKMDSPWQADVQIYAFCPLDVGEMRKAVAYIHLFKSDLESAADLVDGQLANFGYFVFPNESQLRFSVNISLRFNESIALKQRDIVY